MPYDQRRRRDIRHRMFRTMIQSFERDGTKFAVLQTRFAEGMRDPLRLDSGIFPPFFPRAPRLHPAARTCRPPCPSWDESHDES